MSSPEILSPVSSARCENAMPRDSSASLPNSSPSSTCDSNRMTCTDIQWMLKSKPNECIIIENTGKHTSDCWTLFGYPALVNEYGDPRRINGFVSCRKCLSTYSFVSNSTRFLNRHDCDAARERNRKLQTNARSSVQRCLSSFYPVKPTALKAQEQTKIKDLQTEWICQNVRPFSIVEDTGLRRLIQECICIGENREIEG